MRTVVNRKFCFFLEKSITPKSRMKYSYLTFTNLIRKKCHVFSDHISHNISYYKSFHCRLSNPNHSYHPKFEQEWSRPINRGYEASFTDLTSMRQKQARSSLLIELASKDDANHAAKMCKDVGEVKAFIPYTCGYGNAYLLTEFTDERSTHKILKDCCFKNSTETFPLYSRHIRYERRKSFKKAPTILGEKFGLKTKAESIDSTCKVSQLIQKNYDDTRLSEVSTRLRFFFASILEDAVSGMFPYCSVLPFGSSVNGCGIEGCDLDLMIQISPERISGRSDLVFFTKPVCDPRVIQQRTLNFLYEIIRNILPGINHVNKIKFARVPILKFTHTILEFECDISINNMTAVFMSEVLCFLGSLDSRVRPLIFAVKKWAKEANITYATPGSWITNFSLTLLVVFYLQTLKIPILPPLSKAIAIESYADSFACSGIQYIENPAKWRSLSKANTENLGTLLQGFLNFAATYPFDKMHLSMLHGAAEQRDDSSPIWIQYPLEEDKNVAKNVSDMELKQFQRLAGMSATNLEKYSTEGRKTDLMAFLGVESIQQKAIDVNTLYEEAEDKEHAGPS